MDKTRLRNVVLVAVGAMAFALGYYVFNRITGFGIPCIFHETLNVYCPGCGLSRMFFSIFELNFYQAFRYNPMWFCSLPFLSIVGIDLLLAYLYKRETKFTKKIPMAVWIVVMALFITFGVIRNIEPFTYLAPTEVVNK